ncbi:pesticin C-terminus-like muramidase [bacterium]|nr:pesticin C-terminus-like muramidase [bacterium]
MPNYNTQGITSADPRNLGGSEGYGNPSASSSSGLMSSTSNATANDDNNDEPGFFESIANLFSGAGADLPSDRSDDDGDSGISFYDSPMFTPYDGGSDDSAAASTGLPFSTTAADRAMYEALGVDVPEVYTGKMGEEEPEPNLDMDVLQDALQPEPITVEEIEVKAGDTLTAIAEEKGVSVQSVIDANPQIKNPDLIRPGEKVTLPGMLSTAGKLLKTATDPEAPAPVSEDPDREFYQSGIPLEDRFPAEAGTGTDPRELGGAEGYGSVGIMSDPRNLNGEEGYGKLTKGSNANVDFDFIKKREGFEKDVYVPKGSDGKVLGKSGATVASGFDLGQRNEADLKGLPSALVTKLKPYLGKKGASADTYVTNNPLSLTEEEANTINTFAKKQEIDRVKEDWDNSSSTKDFKDLTKEQATVVASVAFQYGDLPTKTPTFWKHVTAGDWDKAEAELRNFGDAYSTRRKLEADYLAGN